MAGDGTDSDRNCLLQNGAHSVALRALRRSALARPAPLSSSERQKDRRRSLYSHGIHHPATLHNRPVCCDFSEPVPVLCPAAVSTHRAFCRTPPVLRYHSCEQLRRGLHRRGWEAPQRVFATVGRPSGNRAPNSENAIARIAPGFNRSAPRCRNPRNRRDRAEWRRVTPRASKSPATPPPAVAHST